MLGRSAVVIWCDVPPGVRPEWEEWHSQEHMPERLGIPGFLRGTRWKALSGRSSFFVLYETRDLKMLGGRAYLRRLNDPTPWSRKMMPYHRNMMRSYCKVQASQGGVVANVLATVRFSSSRFSFKKAQGVTGVHLLAARPTVTGTTEQKIRGKDKTADRVLLISGYDEHAVRAAVRTCRARGAVIGFYRPAYSLISREP